MSRARVRAAVVASAEVRARVSAIAEAAGLVVVEDTPTVVVREVRVDRGAVGLDDVASVQAAATEAGDALLVVVVPDGTDAYVRASLRRAGAFDVIHDGPDLEDELTGALHVVRRVHHLGRERERLAAELAHHGRISTVGLLAAGVGHEINNPCGAILANTETVRDEIEHVLALPRFQRGDQFHRRAAMWLEALGDTMGATRRITSIVRSLNVFSRRSHDGTPVPTNLNQEVRGVLRLVGKEVQLQAQVTLELAAELPEVSAMPFTMTQVVSNLVINALQSLESTHASPTDRQLVIRTESDEASVLLEVSDNGAGIPPDVIGRVFDPFFTTKAVGSGTGLGLSITRELVQQAGGDVFVESVIGAGATFRVILPARTTPKVVVRPISKAPPPMLRLRVLLVDDDADFLPAMARSLDTHFECVTERSSLAALRRVRSGEHFDAILLDVVMPELDGLETWRAIAAARPELSGRVVLVSGGVASEDLRLAVESTGLPLLTKPVEVATVSAALRAAASDGEPGERRLH